MKASCNDDLSNGLGGAKFAHQGAIKFSGRRDVIWHRLFQLGVAIKGIDGVIETVGGFLFLFINRNTWIQLIFGWTQNELAEDPDDWIATHLRTAFSHLSTQSKAYTAAYLIGHGVVKLVLVAGLWRDKLWAFPVALFVLFGFIGFQSYCLAKHATVGLSLLTVFDLVVMVLVWREYRRVKARK